MPDPRRWQPLTCQHLHLGVSYLHEGGCLGLSILALKCVQQSSCVVQLFDRLAIDNELECFKGATDGV